MKQNQNIHSFNQNNINENIIDNICISTFSNLQETLDFFKGDFL